MSVAGFEEFANTVGTAAPPDSPNKAMLEQSITIESAARKARWRKSNCG